MATWPLRALACLIFVACGPAEPRPVAARAEAETLAFSVKEANTWNYFFRRGPVAAHLLVTSGVAPRVVVAFPAGNAGIGMWLERPTEPVELTVEEAPAAVERPDGMRGVRVVVHSSQSHLRASGVVMSNVRVLRDYASDPKLLPAEIVNQVQPGPPLVIRRTTLDGGHHLELRIEPRGTATASVEDHGAVALDGPGSFALTFLQDDPPLTPIPIDELLTADAAASPRDRQALAFLTYREKMLAGSWRFLTYFGRDTLLSTRLLMPVLRPAAIEGAIGAVLERLDPTGDVAHEEDIGEFAALRNQREGRGPRLDPLFDYKMVDDDFMLAPVVAHYLLDTDAGKAHARAFLAEHMLSGETYAEALDKNLEYVLSRAAPFGKAPVVSNLISLRAGINVGDWRDSEDGLGGGRYAYDINTALVPAALAAAARLYASGLLCRPDEPPCRDRAPSAAALAPIWRDRTRPLFEITLPAAKARELLATYAHEQGIDPAPALASLDGPVAFWALSLDADGRPVPVMSSDDGFALVFGEPPAADLDRMARQVARPFPAGLMTPVGMVIANPAFAGDPGLRGKFARDRYHGVVIWSWQQAMMAAGLAHQLERGDLPAPVREHVVAAQSALWAAIRASDSVRLAEHWSWQIKDGAFAIYRFGEGGDAEANAAQLWSTVYLAVHPPK